MITHVVMFTFRPECRDDLPAARDKLLGMQGKVEVLREIEVGLDELKTERSCDMVLITRFDSFDDLKVYATHPAHLDVIEFLKPRMTLVKAVDYSA